MCFNKGMSFKNSNEITVKVKCELEEFYKILEKKDFKMIEEFTLDDIYMIPSDLQVENLTTREILSKAILIRDINEITFNQFKKKITYKIKNIDEFGNILQQKAISCNVKDIEEAKNFIEAIGYKKIMNIKEHDFVYIKDNFQFAVKDILNGDKLIEVEMGTNEEFDTIEELKNKLEEFQIPVDTNNLFVKKAEMELNKILGRN